MTTESFGPFRSNGKGGPDFTKDLFGSYASDGAEIVGSAFETEKGEIAPMIETADGQFRLIRVDAVTPDAYRPLDEVKAELSAAWTAEQRALAGKARAQKALDALNAGTPLADVAKANGAAVQSFANLKRSAALPAPLTPLAAAQAFTAEKGKAFSSEGADGFIVGVVKSVALPPAPPKDDKDLAALTDLTGRALPEDALGVFVNKLADGRKIRINVPLLEQTYGPKADAPQDAP